MAWMGCQVEQKYYQLYVVNELWILQTTTTLIILRRMLHQNFPFYTVEKPTATNTVGSYNNSCFCKVCQVLSIIKLYKL